MRFAAVHRTFACGIGPAADVPRATLGSWLRIYLACASDEIESPCLEGAKDWPGSRWMRVAGVSRGEVDEVVAAGLAAWEGEALLLRGVDPKGWLGGLRPLLSPDALYGPEWRRIRTQVLKRDGRACTNCGRRNDLEIHHRVPVRRFKGDRKAAHALANLVTLCRGCHVEEDNKIRMEARK